MSNRSRGRDTGRGTGRGTAGGTARGAGRTRVRAAAAALAAAGLALAGCSSSAAKPSASSGARPALTIGISLSLTGDFSDSGKSAQRGYQLWASTVNAAGGVLGRKVVLDIVDDTSSPTQVVTNYQNLITKNHVDLVFGPFSSLLTVPASQVAKRYGYAFLEPAGGGPAVFSQHLHNLFFVQPAPVVQQGDVFADYILSLPASQRPTTAAYPALDDPFASPIAAEVRTRLQAAGIRTVYQQIYPAEATDLSSVVTAMAAKKPDLVVAGTQSADAYALVKAMVQLKWAPKLLYLSNGANDPLNFPGNVGAGNVNGIFSSGDWFPTATTSGNSAFVAAYTAAYGGAATSIDSTSAEAYSCGQLVQEVAAKTGKVDNATLISTLHSGSWPTLEGDLSWNSDGAANASYVLVQWIGGKLLPVFPADRAQSAPVLGKLPWSG
ncbi:MULTISPECIES: amino acid ABC transporter substrate-binding protein [Streptacidiphilus]|uniref:Amino acid ABC transporter substrate-binding protein n=1 Tax=Streptacidiphilus cavernicola TaxID=3342716 RepID=A0ABV6UJ20_9ACTN|nr:amino acid ABC transporter substrate-binding protein [Streptacidiphilus jeojiense]